MFIKLGGARFWWGRFFNVAMGRKTKKTSFQYLFSAMVSIKKQFSGSYRIIFQKLCVNSYSFLIQD